jgi:hypothetical protein
VVSRRHDRTELIAILKSLRPKMKVELKYSATPAMRQKGNPFLNAVKHQHLVGTINFHYEELRDEVEPDGYTAGPRVWGTRLPDCPLVEHNGVLYLEVLPEDVLTPTFYTQYGHPVDKAEVERFLKSKPEGSTFNLFPRDYKVEGITEITLFHPNALPLKVTVHP